MTESKLPRYVSLVPANDWYFVHEGTTPDRRRVLHRVAVWAQREDGSVIGLISVEKMQDGPHQVPRLVEPPPIEGGYLHEDQLR